MLHKCVLFCSYEDTEDAVDLSLNCIRPRARKIIKFSDVKEGDKVMINYNIEEPNERGFWYDCEVTGKKQNRTKSFLVGTITMGFVFGLLFLWIKARESHYPFLNFIFFIY